MKEICTRGPKMVAAKRSDTIEACVKKMIAADVRHLPVIDDDTGEVFGLISVKASPGGCLACLHTDVSEACTSARGTISAPPPPLLLYSLPRHRFVHLRRMCIPIGCCRPVFCGIYTSVHKRKEHLVNATQTRTENKRDGQHSQKKTIEVRTETSFILLPARFYLRFSKQTAHLHNAIYILGGLDGFTLKCRLLFILRLVYRNLCNFCNLRTRTRQGPFCLLGFG